jgi:hypothetical protein
MRALVYLLSARALDVARDAGSARRPVPEVALGPLATTPETASAWRRWAETRETPVTTEDLRPSPVRPSSERRTTPA